MARRASSTVSGGPAATLTWPTMRGAPGRPASARAPGEGVARRGGAPRVAARPRRAGRAVPRADEAGRARAPGPAPLPAYGPDQPAGPGGRGRADEAVGVRGDAAQSGRREPAD